ncbi:MAG: thioredoxin family protein [Gammaproteobacteria bacterium]
MSALTTVMGHEPTTWSKLQVNTERSFTVTIEVELFYSRYCRHCGASRADIRALVGATPGVRFEELDVLEHIERAASRGVLATPAVAINGTLVMAGALSLPRLRALLSNARERHDLK